MQRRIEETEERCREADRERESVKRQLETTCKNMPSVEIYDVKFQFFNSF